MSWNGSSGVEETNTSQKDSVLRLNPIIIFLIIGISLIFAIWYFTKTTHVVNLVHQDTHVKDSIIAEHKPSKNIRKSTAYKAEEAIVPKGPRRIGEIRDGKVLLPSGRLYTIKGIITNNSARTSFMSRTFKHQSDKLIGSLIMVEPGDGLLGSSEELYEGFDDEFKKSIVDDIEYSKDDTEFQRQLKDAVVDLRKELMDRMSKGENLAQLMIDTRNQLMEMATYREDLEQEVERLSQDGELSENDYEELIKAANTLLEERGVKPFELPSAAKYAIELQTLNGGNQE